jgi:hypothetical protein
MAPVFAGNFNRVDDCESLRTNRAKTRRVLAAKTRMEALLVGGLHFLLRCQRDASTAQR